MKRLFANVVLVSFLLAGSARADDDHNLARAALARGEILSLSQILPALEARLEARLIDAELDFEAGRLVYELSLITADGRLLDVVVDAASGTQLAPRTGAPGRPVRGEDGEDDSGGEGDHGADGHGQGHD